MKQYHANTIYKYHLRCKKNFALRVLAIKDGQYVFFVATRVTNYLRKWRVVPKYPSDIILVTKPILK